MTDREALLKRQLERERAARLEAERLLEEKADELYASLMQIGASENLLNTALNSMTDGLLLTRQDHRVVIANAQFAALYPETVKSMEAGDSLVERFEALANHPDYLDILSSDDGQGFFEWEPVDGMTLSVGVRVTKEGLIASTHRDISEIRSREKERRDLLFELLAAQRLEALGRLAGTIAHDFNNVVAAIRGYAGFLHEDLPGDDERKAHVRRILGASDRASDLIDQLLARQQRREDVIQPVSLIPVLDDSCDLALSKEGKTHDVFDFEPPDEPIWVHGDENLISRLFTNLLGNALQSLPPDEGEIRIEVSTIDEFRADAGEESGASDETTVNRVSSGQLAIPHRCALVTIEDEGSGMERDVMERMFEMYFTTRSGERNSGLGMASVSDVIDDLGGCIQVASRPGSGTSINVVLPSASKGSPFLPKVNTDKESDNLAPADVLVVDDEQDVGDVIVEMLERDGISATFTTSPEAALNNVLASPDRWRMVVCDQTMPRLRGSELLHHLRASNVGIPFVMCSARVDPSDREFVRSLGDRFIRKPIDRANLLKIVRDNLQDGDS